MPPSSPGKVRSPRRSSSHCKWLPTCLGPALAGPTSRAVWCSPSAALQGAQRPIEVGVSAHIGERVLEVPAPVELRHYQTWSFNVDLRAALTERTRIQGEFFIGQVLGSYDGGIFQGIDPVTLNAIRALGGWLELEHQLTECLRAARRHGC